ncbi:hypothetical protein [Nonomuraea sp. NPDC052265]|uniref:hypothetical protein n=1 Tax=Nonomuraea sp. NPDC052265 TaxID=3364374 RepID=UPI0037C96DA9
MLKKREAAFSQTAKTTEKRISGTRVNIQLSAVCGLLDRDMDTGASAFVARRIPIPGVDVLALHADLLLADPIDARRVPSKIG